MQGFVVNVLLKLKLLIFIKTLHHLSLYIDENNNAMTLSCTLVICGFGTPFAPERSDNMPFKSHDVIVLLTLPYVQGIPPPPPFFPMFSRRFIVSSCRLQ